MMIRLLVAFVFALSSSVWAHGGGDDDDGPPAPRPTPSTPSAEYRGNATAHVLGYTAVSAVMTTALKDTAHPVLYAFAGTVALAAAQEVARSGPFDSRNMRYNILGAALGSVGTGIVVGPRFLGWKAVW